MKWGVIDICEEKIKCPSWKVCGAAMVHHYWIMQAKDQRSDWMGEVCCNEAEYQNCPHRLLRIN